MKKKNKALHYHEQKLADQDYVNKLNNEDKEWLAQFNKEYYQAIYKGDERIIHGKEYDEELKAARSARRKDICDVPHTDIIYTEIQSYDNDSDNQLYSETEIEKLSKIDVSEALNILREQSKDMIINKIDTIENILSDLQRDSLKIFIKARENK